jgi:hypothetical protein
MALPFRGSFAYPEVIIKRFNMMINVCEHRKSRGPTEPRRTESSWDINLRA